MRTSKKKGCVVFVIEKYYTPEEIAELLTVSPQTVRRWVQHGKMKGVHLNQKIIRVKESDLVDFLENQSIKPLRRSGKAPKEVK